MLQIIRYYGSHMRDRQLLTKPWRLLPGSYCFFNNCFTMFRLECLSQMLWQAFLDTIYPKFI